MPGMPEEYAALAAGDDLLPGRWRDGTDVSADEWRDVLALRGYVARMRRTGASGQKRARVFFRSLLSREQRRELTRASSVVVTVASGRSYRITPRMGCVERVTRHKGRWFACERYCLHDEQDDDAMPPADLSAAHLLMLLSDEAAFLATANARDARDQLWNRDYLRRLRQRGAVQQ